MAVDLSGPRNHTYSSKFGIFPISHLRVSFTICVLIKYQVYIRPTLDGTVSGPLDRIHHKTKFVVAGDIESQKKPDRFL